MSKQFLRTELLIGKEKLARLHKSRVAVIGLGAVGSYAVEALARAGIGHLCVIDCDVINESNINRQLYALHSTVGRAKVELAKERILDIYPKCKVEGLQMFAHSYSIGRVMEFRPDLVLDAVDSLNAKAGILAELHTRGVPVLSSMGAALRRDPSKIKFGDISETRGCPLAKLLRKRLRHKGIKSGIACVYSTEETTGLFEEEAAAEEGTEDTPFWQGRKRSPLGSLPTLTGIFGLTLAHYAIEFLVKDG